VCSLNYNDLDAEAAKHLCDALKVNETLTALEYAALHPTALLSPARARLLLLAAADTLIAPSFNLLRPSLSSALRSLTDNGIGPDGAKHLGEALVTNTTLKELRYAAPPLPRSRKSQRLNLLLAAADTLIAPSFNLFRPSLSFRASLRSLDSNKIGPDGAKHLGEALKVNKALTNLKYAAFRPNPTLCSRPTVSSR
jgi:Ran GTPase-activating protein (RanGAP) involved in mRNA processing and transport